MNPLPYRSWLQVHSLGMLAAFCLGLTGPGLALICLYGLLSILGLLWLGRAEWHAGYWLGGPANLLTLLRLSGIALVGLSPAPPWLVGLAGLAAIGLDAVDGPLARYLGTESRLGGMLDAETDAFFVLVLSWQLWHLGLQGPWVLGMGLIRYVYAIPDLLLPGRGHTGKEGGAYARIIAGIVMVGLPLAFILPPVITDVGMPGLGLLLAYSFGRSAWERFGG